MRNNYVRNKSDNNNNNDNNDNNNNYNKQTVREGTTYPPAVDDNPTNRQFPPLHLDLPAVGLDAGGLLQSSTVGQQNCGFG